LIEKIILKIKDFNDNEIATCIIVYEEKMYVHKIVKEE